MRKIPIYLFLVFSFFSSLFSDDSQSLVRQIKITTDKAPDTSSLKSIVESITKGLKTNDEKAIAIYNYLLYNCYHYQYPQEKGGVAALKVLNVYGWSLCGGLHTVQAAMWKELGWKWRYVGWSDHTTTEAFYDNSWHYFDVFTKFYTWRSEPSAANGRTVASQEDIKKDPSIVLDQFVFDSNREVWYQKENVFKIVNDKANWQAPAFLVCRDTPKAVVQGASSSRVAGSPEEWAGIKFREDGYTTDVNLVLGTRLTLLWSPLEKAHWWLQDRKKTPVHTCSERDFRNSPSCGLLIEPYRVAYKSQGRTYASGQYQFNPTINPAVLKSFAASENLSVQGNQLVPTDSSKPSWFIVKMESPYVMSLGKASITDTESAEVSVDGGKTFKPISLADFSNQIGGTYSALIKVTVIKPISMIDIEVIVEQNYRALPYLSPGKNVVTVALAKPEELEDKQLVITYGFNPGFKTASFEAYAESGKEVAKAHNTVWSNQLFYVQKILKAADFKQGKYEFNIDIGTPNGKYPAYPRMVFLKREVIAANEKPNALPEGAVAYEGVPNSEMLTLPYPFHTDLAVPEVEKQRETKIEKMVVDYGFAVQGTGEVAPNHYIKTKSGEDWRVLIKANLSALKDASNFNKIEIALPVIRTIKQAKVKLGVYVLNEPYEKDKAYDFKKIGSLAGTAVLPAQPEDKDYTPAKHFKIDITKSIKAALQAGQKEIYLALATIPDRTIDDGYTVRIDFDHQAEFFLEAQVFAD